MCSSDLGMLGITPVCSIYCRRFSSAASWSLAPEAGCAAPDRPTFPQLLISGWHQGRDKKLKIVGPKGTCVHVAGLMAFWKEEMLQRVEHEARPSTIGLEVQVEEIDGEWSSRCGDVEIRAVEVDHKPVQHALGYVFSSSGKTAAISGDTRPCAALEVAAAGCDVLVHEVLVARELPAVPGRRTVETVSRVASYHTSSRDAGKVASRTSARALVLTHVVPPDADRARLLAEISADYKGPCMIAEDLMQLDLATGVVSAGNVHWTLGA
jgi:ribonuclease Z